VKLVGVDPSSSCSGVAYMDRKGLLLTDTWKRPSSGSAPERLYQFHEWLIGWLRRVGVPDMAAVEFLSVERNAQSTRVVSHYQSAAVLACKRLGVVVVEGRVSTARKIALGSGALSKRDAFDAVKRLYPNHDFGRFDKGGSDRADAVVMALAARTLAET
jgi:Holliday junction resolvasome RuvABC endonuclease subunit